MIYYAHINEDNEVERQFMNAGHFQNLVCIAGSGERVLALLAHPSLKQVRAIDNNIEALFLLELKLKALENLSVEDYLKFIGFSQSETPEQFFDSFKQNLSTPCLNFWNNRRKAIKKGILNYGHFEQYLRRFRPLFRLFLGKAFYQSFERPFRKIETFPHRKWALLKRLFSQRWTFILGGNRDLAFVAPDARTAHIPAALQAVLEENLVQQSFMFHLIFKGHLKEMKSEYLPSSLKTDHLQQVKKTLTAGKLKISYHHEDLNKFLLTNEEKNTQNTFYSFSDILSFCDFEYLNSSIQIINNQLNTNHSGVFRAFIRNRLSNEQAALLQSKLEYLTETSAMERTRMYQVFNFKI